MNIDTGIVTVIVTPNERVERRERRDENEGRNEMEKSEKQSEVRIQGEKGEECERLSDDKGEARRA
jgi:hypothetical protein